MTHLQIIRIIAQHGFSVNCRKKTALEAVIDCAEKGNEQAINCLKAIQKEDKK